MPWIAQGQTEAKMGKNVPGFQDFDKNGVNDKFADANGDGVNDVTGQTYPCHFKYQDKDGDGVNDLWKDADGDGVNDYLGDIQKALVRWVDQDGDGIADETVGQLKGKDLKQHALDMDQDGLNDITGLKITGRDLNGQRYGMVDEEDGYADPDYVDADGDGMNDHSANNRSSGKGGPSVDIFIDSNGDGIADDRGWGRVRGKRKARNK